MNTIKPLSLAKLFSLAPTAINYQNRGMAYFHAGDYDKAIVDFGDAIGLARENATWSARAYWGGAAQFMFVKVITTKHNRTLTRR